METLTKKEKSTLKLLALATSMLTIGFIYSLYSLFDYISKIKV